MKSDIPPIYQSNILVKSATFQLHFGFSRSFSATPVLHLNFIGKPMFWIMGCRTLTLTTMNTNTETNTAIYTAHNLIVWAADIGGTKLG